MPKGIYPRKPAQTVTITCRYCGSPRTVLAKSAHRYGTCGSDECVRRRRVEGGSVPKVSGAEHYNFRTGQWSKAEKVCEMCGTPFIGIAKRRFCSMKCAGENARKTQTGATFSEDRKARMKGRSGTGPKSEAWKDAASERFRGPSNPNWLGGRYQDGQRGNTWYAAWRAAVYERDRSICQVCKRPDKLVAHHIKEWMPHPELRYVVENGITLCRPCHARVHKGSLSLPDR